MSIQEIAKMMNRIDFINVMARENPREIGFITSCPKSIEFELKTLNEEKCNPYNNDVCKSCWELAVKDIKFKEDIKEDEEVEGLNFRDVIANIKENEKYECEGFTIENLKNGTIEIKSAKTNRAFGFLKDDKFTKIQLKVDFSKAWKAYQEGKIIESAETGDKYQKCKTHMLIKKKDTNYFGKCTIIYPKELEGEWIIQE